jgi:hypothetical protein
MPDLSQSLQGRDLGHLRIIADLWGIKLSAPDARVGLVRLNPLMQDRELLAEVIQLLPEAARAALEEILRNDGRLPWSLLIRRYGAVREMGAARRDRERPYQNASASAAEALWYRGLIGRAFFDTTSGPEEFAYIPDELLVLMPPAQPRRSPSLGRPATPAERATILLASDRLLDDACTMLAALRLEATLQAQPAAKPGLASQSPVERSDFYALRSNPLLPYPLTAELLQALLATAGLLDARHTPRPEPTRAFLEAPRAEALLSLFQAWLRSQEFNELRLTPALVTDGAWVNDPLRARQAILDFIFTVPGAVVAGEPAERPFWSLTSLVNAVRQSDPDFQRTAGEYDTWFLRRRDTGENLRGFESWEAVEGELIRFIIAGPLHWLGIVDLGLPEPPATEAGSGVGHPPQQATAFRFSAWAADLLSLKPPTGLAAEGEAIQVNRDGRLHIPARAPRVARYQAARFAAWERYALDSYHYRLTPASLEAARQAGLNLQHLTSLLRHHARAVPPGLLDALERWETSGSAARLERVLVLRVKDPELLQALRTSTLARYFGELLGPTAVIIRPGGVEKLVDGLVEMGYFTEVELVV